MFRLAQAVSDIVRTTLGPRAMLKMLLDSSGGMRKTTSESIRCKQMQPLHLSALAGIVLTNDGNAILREIDVTHPAAKVGFDTCCCICCCTSLTSFAAYPSFLTFDAVHDRAEQNTR